jgi:hypothetical protein
MKQLVADQPLGRTVLLILGNPVLRKIAGPCVKNIFFNFFFLQYRAALLPGRIPVTPVDHPLDEKIPFRPQWVGVYLDFIAFWVRIAGFLLRHYRRRAIEPVRDFIGSMGRLYGFAAEVYRKNLSTTNRPRYYARPRFLLIHATDPHLMCIPSLHVMVVIRAYTKFRAILRDLGGEARFAPQIEEIRRGALAITEAILYVKQHSVNCVAASLYAMTRFDPPLFSEADALEFAAPLFTRPGSPPESAALRAYITEKYQTFAEAGRHTPDWKAPLLAFLSNP